MASLTCCKSCQVQYFGACIYSVKLRTCINSGTHQHLGTTLPTMVKNLTAAESVRFCNRAS